MSLFAWPNGALSFELPAAWVSEPEGSETIMFYAPGDETGTLRISAIQVFGEHARQFDERAYLQSHLGRHAGAREVTLGENRAVHFVEPGREGEVVTRTDTWLFGTARLIVAATFTRTESRARSHAGETELALAIGILSTLRLRKA